MRAYQVPQNMNEKEKIVGGIFDLGQALWLGGGLALGLATFLLLNSLMGYASLIFAVPIAFTGTPFVFYKPKGLTLYKYLKRKQTFKKKTKVLQFRRKIKEW